MPAVPVRRAARPAILVAAFAVAAVVVGAC
jgi:hypothetical protein